MGEGNLPNLSEPEGVPQLREHKTHRKDSNKVTATPTNVASKQEFVIDTREKADWLLRKLANLDAEEARITAQAQTMLRQIESDRNSLREHFGPQLENFTREEIERAGGKRKSITLFNGTIGFRSVPARLVIESESDALQTARLACPEAITSTVVERFDKKAFSAYASAHFEETGELLPGLTRTEPREDFAIRFPSDTVRSAPSAKESGKEAKEE